MVETPKGQSCCLRVSFPPLLSVAYWPPIDWFALWVRSEAARLEAHESLQKQSYRNRCRILSTHGVQELVIPLDRSSSKHIQHIQLSTREDWWRVHWKAIETAYANAGFYAPFREEIEDLYLGERPQTLWEWNLKILELCTQWLEIEHPMTRTEGFEREDPNDFRQRIHPKQAPLFPGVPYRQGRVGGRLQPFVPNMSILDLLFHEGPAAYSVLLGFS